GRAQADGHLLAAVGAGLAGAVQEEDQRGGLVGGVVGRHEQDVLRLLAVGVLVNPVEEAPVALPLGGPGAGQAGRGQAGDDRGGPLGSGHGALPPATVVERHNESGRVKASPYHRPPRLATVRRGKWRRPRAGLEICDGRPNAVIRTGSRRGAAVDGETGRGNAAEAGPDHAAPLAARRATPRAANPSSAGTP